MGWRSQTARMLRPQRRQEISLNRYSPFQNEEYRSLREEAALSLMDPDTHGYVLLVLKRQQNGTGRIQFASRINREWLPAFSLALRKASDAIR